MKNDFQRKKRRNTILYVLIRVILGILFCGAVIFTIFIGRKPYGEELKEGDVSLRTIYSPITFKYRTGIDEERTELERKKAAQGVDAVYEIDAEITRQQIDKAEQFFRIIRGIKDIAGLADEERLVRVKAKLEIELSDSDIKAFLADKNPEATKNKTIALIQNVLKQGLISEKLKKRIAKSERSHITLITLHPQVEIKTPVEKLVTRKKIKKDLNSLAQEVFPEDRKLRLAAISLTEKILKANINFNAGLTQKRRKLAADNVPLQYQEKEVKKEELIIGRGARVSKKHLLKIKEMFRRQGRVNRFMFFAGASILALIFLYLIAAYLNHWETKIFSNSRKLILITTLFILILGLAKLITYSPFPSYTIPVSIAAILIAVLIGARVAIMLTFIMSIFVGVIAGDKLDVATVSFVGSMAGVFFIQGARRRSQILLAGCVVGLANFASICAIELLHGLKYDVFLIQGFFGLINGLASAVIITGVLPVFEYMFNIVTNISLLEASDLNHPLLKEMILQAPGTYHHSLIVGNLAEAACDAIGANSLLARVGSYFHDIGKIEKAEYFSENQIGAEKKKHDKLTPSMSSLIITNHVKDGVELARKYKLNQTIIDFIEQHHGTSLIYYFYQRALEKVEGDEIPKEEGFRYPGPKPQTKEAAVALLADSVEAASRALSVPTPARIKGLVRKIINNKFIDNQLDQCDLTLRDLDAIADAFTRILMGIFHSRVEYEKNEKSKASH